MYLSRLIIIALLLFVYSCNQNLSDEEKKEMWSKAQTTGAIIDRSGTSFNSAINKDLALQDAETRLQTGGGLFGKGLKVDGILNQTDNNKQVATYGIPINQYLWRGSLETISFMPLSSADPIGGTIITDWYTSENNEDERCKLNIFISGSELKTQNLKVTSFCEVFKNNRWIARNVDPSNNIKLENAILNKAKKLKLSSS